MTFNIQWECFISAKHSYVRLKFVNDIPLWHDYLKVPFPRTKKLLDLTLLSLLKWCCDRISIARGGDQCDQMLEYKNGPNISQKQILHESCVFQCSPKKSPKIWATFVWDNFSPWALKVAQSGHAGGGDNLGTKRRSSQRLKSESLPSRGSFRPKLYHKTCIRDGKERERERKWESKRKKIKGKGRCRLGERNLFGFEIEKESFGFGGRHN